MVCWLASINTFVKPIRYKLAVTCPKILRVSNPVHTQARTHTHKSKTRARAHTHLNARTHERAIYFLGNCSLLSYSYVQYIMKFQCILTEFSMCTPSKSHKVWPKALQRTASN